MNSLGSFFLISAKDFFDFGHTELTPFSLHDLNCSPPLFYALQKRFSSSVLLSYEIFMLFFPGYILSQN